MVGVRSMCVHCSWRKWRTLISYLQGIEASLTALCNIVHQSTTPIFNMIRVRTRRSVTTEVFFCIYRQPYHSASLYTILCIRRRVAEFVSMSTDTFWRAVAREKATHHCPCENTSFARLMPTICSVCFCDLLIVIAYAKRTWSSFHRTAVCWLCNQSCKQRKRSCKVDAKGPGVLYSSLCFTSTLTYSPNTICYIFPSSIFDQIRQLLLWIQNATSANHKFNKTFSWLCCKNAANIN